MRFFWLGCLLAVGTASCSLSTQQQDSSTIRIRWTRDPETLSPLALPNQNAIDAANLLHCGLLQQDFSTGAYLPALAESLPQARPLGDSLLQLRYQLRAEATWDDGRPVLATDVAFTLKLLRCPGLPNEMAQMQSGFIQAIELDATNPRRFTFICRGQSPEYPKQSGEFPILPEAALDPTHTLRSVSLADFTSSSASARVTPLLQALAQRYQAADPGHHPNRLPGCGPYRLTNWDTSRLLTFARKTHWWADALHPTPFILQARAPHLQFLIISDDATAALALRRREVDVVPQLSAREFRRLQESSARKELAFYSTASHEIAIAGFNTRRSTLHDSLTRQALSRLFDPARLLQATQLGQGLLTVGLVHPSDHRNYNDSLSLLTYSPAQAQALLRQAGWQRQPTGWTRPNARKLPERLALTIRYRAGETTFEMIALQFKAAAAALTIPVELRPTEASLLTKALHAGNFDLYIRTLKGSPSAFNYAPILHSRTVHEGNFTKFSNLANDQLMEAIVAASVPSQQRLLLRRFQVLLRQQAPLVPLFFLPYRLAANKRVQHVYPSAVKPGYNAAAMTWLPVSETQLPAQ
jgi:ABC-type transport system substrate-binding protein